MSLAVWLMQRTTARIIVLGIVCVVFPCGGVFLILGHLKVAKYDQLSMCTTLISIEKSSISYLHDKGDPPKSIEQLVSAGYIRSYYDKDREDEYAAFAPGDNSYAKWKHVESAILAFPTTADGCVLKGHVLVDKATGTEYPLVSIPGFETPPNISEDLAKAWLGAVGQRPSQTTQAVGTREAG